MTNPSLHIEISESTYAIFRIEDSILYGTIKAGVTIDLEAAKHIGQARRAFLKGRSYPAIANIRHVELITKEARNYLEKEAIIEKTQSGVTAVAVLVRNRLTVITANLFMKIVRPKTPTRVFMTREQALKWVKQFLKG